MADQPGFTRFRSRFESVLQTYQQTTGVTLSEHPLAVQLQSCHSLDTITTILKYEARASCDFLGSDRVMMSMENTISMLFSLSRTATFGDAIALPYPPAKAILAGLAILFDTSKGVNSNHDSETLIDLLEYIEHFLKRVDIYTRIPPTPVTDDTVFKIILELLSTLALATKEVKHGRSIKIFKRGEKNVEAVLQRLDRLTQDEARTTAAQTLEVVHGLVQNMRAIVDDGRTSVDHVREALEILHQMASRKNKSKRDKLRKDIQRWLSPPDPWKNYNIARKSRHNGTGVWILKGETLSQWKAFGSKSLLWIHGKPGAGKSVLCSAIIEDIETMRKSGLASLALFYHDFREGQKKDLRGLLSSVLFQLCDQSNSYHSILSDFYSFHRDGAQSPSDDELAQCLIDLLGITGQAPVYLIIDALDECPNTYAIPSPRQEILSLVVQLMESQLNNLRICVTSRPETDIKRVLEPFTFRSVSIHDERGQMEDIENYIRSIVNMDPKNRRWKAEDRQLVINALIASADGMFRWVYCQLAYLCGCQPGRIRHALAELPETLDETYERTLGDISKADSELAHRLFQCVAVTSRPLRVEELAEFLAFDFEAGQIPKFYEGWRPEDPLEAVLSTCSTLLSLVNVDGSAVIQFSHFSVKEFLTSTRFSEKHDTTSRRYHVSLTHAHTLVAQACLGILLHLDENATRDSLDKFPLVKYAARYWFVHARFEGVSQNAEEGMIQLFNPSKPHLAVWLWIYNPIRPYRRAEKPSTPHGTPLHHAAFCGLHTIVNLLAIEHPENVHSQDLYNRSTPLHLASRQGYAEVARILVEHGADVSAKDSDSSTPLHLASSGGHVNLVRFLVENGADMSAKHHDGSTPLHEATSGGHVDLAQFLVENGADVTAKRQDGLTPLHEASSRGDVELARYLVEHGADVSAKRENGLTPLHEASSRGDVDLARFLVERGADVSAKYRDGSTPLHEATSGNHVVLAQFLVEHGADVSAMREDRSTPLHEASSWGDVDLARFLVEHGADVSSKREDGLTPLHEASSRGDMDLVRFLVEHGADVSTKHHDGSTPLHEATSGDHVDITLFLVEHGADVSAMREDGLTPLHLVSSRGDVDLARFFVEHGADVSAKREDGLTPLHSASSGGHVDLARFLVEHGADVSAVLLDGSTPLQWASSGGHMDFVRFLVEYGAVVSATRHNGWTPLHSASSRGDVDLTQFLIEHGADMSAKNKNGWTPLHRASTCGHVAVAQFLVEHGADMSAKDRDGSTPLHQASSSGHVHLARLLIEHGADVSAKREDGSTPLHQASSSGHVDLVQILVEHGADVTAKRKDGSTPLHQASSSGHVDLARFLVEHGADVSAKDQYRLTPLHSASSRRHMDLAQFLIEHGANVSAKDRYRLTPLHEASSRGHVDLARFLVEHGADVSAKNKDGWTPLHLASSGGHVNLVRFLVEHGANVSVKNENGWTPLHQASSRGYVYLAQFLVEHGADMSAKNENGWTPLHSASSHGHVDLARVLIEHNADVLAKLWDGSTPLHLASSGGHVDLARFLVEHGADMSAMGRYGWTPLHEASSSGHVDLARFLVEHGADVSAKDRYGWTALREALFRRHMDLSWFLIEQGADATA